MENKTEVQLKAKATNWLLTALIAVVGWVGKEQYNALQQINEELKKVGTTVQVHDREINDLRYSTNVLSTKLDQVMIRQYERPVGKHEEFFEVPKRPAVIIQ